MIPLGTCPAELIPFRDHLPTCEAPRFPAYCTRDGYTVMQNDASAHRVACRLQRESTEIFAVFISRVVERGSITQTEDGRIETPTIYEGSPRLSRPD